MVKLKFFKSIPAGMKNGACIFCSKTACDVLIQENIPGGAGAVAHSICLAEFLSGGRRWDGEVPTSDNILTDDTD